MRHLLILVLCVYCSVVSAHRGGTNDFGCHNHRKDDGSYHCHNKKGVPPTLESPKPVLGEFGVYLHPPQNSPLPNANVFFIPPGHLLAIHNSSVGLEYNRSSWGSRWRSQHLGCRNTRREVLKNFHRGTSAFTCFTGSGEWLDPYTGTLITDSGDLDVDHLVPVEYAHNHGGKYWTGTLKNAFYNDFENLIPVDSSANRSKGGKSPADWMPSNSMYHCQYVLSFMYIVDKYHLELTDIERADITKRCSTF